MCEFDKNLKKTKVCDSPWKNGHFLPQGYKKKVGCIEWRYCQRLDDWPGAWPEWEANIDFIIKGKKFCLVFAAGDDNRSSPNGRGHLKPTVFKTLQVGVFREKKKGEKDDMIQMRKIDKSLSHFDGHLTVDKGQGHYVPMHIIDEMLDALEALAG